MSRPGFFRRPLTWGPWVFFAMFAVIIAVNAVMVAFAFSTWTGLETKGHYEKGLAYNKTLEAARRQDALGWQVDIALEQGDAEKVWLEVTFRDPDDRPLRLQAVEARLVRPTHSGHDFEVPLARLQEGRYGTELTPPLPGQWDIRVKARHDGGIYQATRRVMIR